MTNAAPAMNTERGPAVGCAMAHVRYSADISRVALPASIRKSCEIGASAVEISVLLTGLRPTPNIIAMMKVLGKSRMSQLAMVVKPKEKARMRKKVFFTRSGLPAP